MFNTCELSDINNALDANDLKFAAVLLKDYLFNKPDDGLAWEALARYFIDMDLAPFAYPIAKGAAQVDPSWRNLMMVGACQAVLQLPGEAKKTLKRALAKLPAEAPDTTRAIIYRLMGNAAVQGFDFDGAEHWAKKALAIEEHHQAHTVLGFAKLHKREWAEGWKQYEYQLGTNDKRPKHDYGLPEWDGNPNSRLLVYGDQGLGDQIAYMSACNNPPAQLNCHPKLANLFARTFKFTDVHGDMFKSQFDWELKADAQTSMATAMRWQSVERRGRYLSTRREKVLQWNGLLASVSATRPRVGIAWTGGNTGSDGWRSRNLTLDTLEPLLNMPVTWVSLEYKDRQEEIERFKDRTGIEIHDWAWGTQTDDYEDTAALVDCLDAVVTVPTTAYHLAGALGKPACVLVHDQPHFHEGLRGDCPWWQSVDFIRRPDYKSDEYAIDAACKWLEVILSKEKTG